jgi:hypothetical protein
MGLGIVISLGTSVHQPDLLHTKHRLRTYRMARYHLSQSVGDRDRCAPRVRQEG